MNKHYEVYEEFQPWMFGQTVEVGLYSIRDRVNGEPLTGTLVASHGGKLLSYTQATPLSPDSNRVVFKGGTTIEWQDYEYDFLVSVIEENRNR